MLFLKRFFSVVFLFAAISLIVYTISIVGKNFRFSSTQRLELLWKEDIQNLAKAQKLPQSWRDIRAVERTAPSTDKRASRWTHEVAVPVKVNPNGNYKLDVLFVSQDESPHLKALMQMNIVDIKSGNTIWELDRTYDLK